MKWADRSIEPSTLVTRKLFICTGCEGVYADDMVSACDCRVDGKTQFIPTFCVYDSKLMDKTDD